MMKVKSIQKVSAVVCCATILSSVAGCGNTNNTATTKAAQDKTNATTAVSTEKASEPTKITMMTPMYLAQPPRIEGNPILEKLQEATNTQLDIQFIPSATYKDKLNVTIASNQLPMVTVTDAGIMRTSNIVNGAMNGMFWDIEEPLKSYPNLSGFYNNPTVIDNARIDGKLYGLPRPRALGRPGLMIRQDWLDNLGLKMPTNADEVYEVVKAFTHNDPDKNGQADTTGIEYADISVGSYGWNGISTLTVAAGGFNEWGLQDGKMIPDFLTTKYMDTLKFFNKMYNEKLMNQDFPLVTGTKREDVFTQGKVGMMFGTVDDTVKYQTKLSKVDPNAKLAIVPALSGPEGPKVSSTPGHNGILMFSKTSVKTEEDLNKILAFYDTMTTPEMLDLFTYGVEGINYKVENGVKKVIENSNFAEDTTDLAMVILRPGYVETEMDSEAKKAVNAAFKANEAYLVFNPTVAYSSPTKNEKGGELDKMIFDARVKFVMGEIDEAGFNKVLEQWRKQGGDNIIEEFTEQYNKLSKK